MLIIHQLVYLHISSYPMKLHRLLCFFLLSVSISPVISAPVNWEQKVSGLHNRLQKAAGSEKIQVLLELAELCNPDSLHQAFVLTREAIAEGKKLPDKKLLADAYVGLAGLFIRVHDAADSAGYYISAAERAYKSSPGRKAPAKYFYILGNRHFRMQDMSEANSCLQLAIEKGLAEEDHLTVAQAQLLMAKVARSNGDTRGFIDWLNKAGKSFLLSDNKIQAGPAMISIGVMLKDAGLDRQGDQALINAIAVCEQAGDKQFVGYLYCNVAGIFESGPDKGRTLGLFRKAEKIFASLNNDRGLGYTLNHIGMYYRKIGQSDQALSCFRRAIVHKKRINDWQGACFAACNMAEVYLEERNHEALTGAFREAHEYMERAGDKLSETVYYNTLARFHAANKEYSEAIECYQASLQAARESFNQNFVLDNLKAIGELYQSMGEEKEALVYLNRYIQAGDSVKAATGLQSNLDMQAELDKITNATSGTGNSFVNLISDIRRIAIPAAFLLVVVIMGLSAWGFGGNRNTIDNKVVSRKQEMPASSGQLNLEITPEINRVRPALSESTRNDIWLRLNHLMENEKCFLDKDISQHELALRLGTNTNYLSKVVNELTGDNFNAFVNKYRIEEACRLLAGSGRLHMSIEGIALTVGFNSKSAFNTAFKKFRGMTPKEFYERSRIPGELLSETAEVAAENEG